MNKIFKYYEYVDNNFTDPTEKLISDIVTECLRDFCFVNSLKYFLEFGRFINYSYNGDDPSDLIGFVEKDELKTWFEHPDIFPELLELKNDFLPCFQIKIQSTNYEATVWEMDKIEKLILLPDYKNCISHLKSSLERELHDVDFNICQDDHIYLIKYEITYKKDIDENE